MAPEPGPPAMITDVDDPRLSDYRGLRHPDRRLRLESERGIFIAEGETVVRRLLASPYPVRSVLVTDRGLRRLGPALEGSGLPVLHVSDETARALVGFDLHRGVLASGVRLAEPDPACLLASSSTVVVLEDVTDQVNTGAIFRNALALGAQAALLSPGCCDPLYRRSVRVSMGACLHLPFARLPSWPLELHAMGRTHSVLALTPDPGAPDLEEVATSVRGPVAVVAGTEGTGLSGAALGSGALPVRIPMGPGSDSLNVATALAVALYRLGLRSR